LRALRLTAPVSCETKRSRIVIRTMSEAQTPRHGFLKSGGSLRDG
jgi:hypothetical protein